MKCTKEVKGLLYSCKPILDYATVFWDPYQQYLINEIEKVQRRAARWVMGDCRYISSVSSMISALQWPSLEWHLHNRLTFYNFVNKVTVFDLLPSTYNIPPPHYIIRWSSMSHYQMSYFPMAKTICDLNNLPHQIIELQSFNTFSGRFMHHHWLSWLDHQCYYI